LDEIAAIILPQFSIRKPVETSLVPHGQQFAALAGEMSRAWLTRAMRVRVLEWSGTNPIFYLITPLFPPTRPVNGKIPALNSI
jgi:hypothetical protein